MSDIKHDRDFQIDDAQEVYDAEDLLPGGAGKQGDQQQMGQKDRESRRDKSKSDGDSDKLHEP